MARIGLDARLTYYSQAGIAQYIQALIRELPALDTRNEYLILHSRKDRRDLAQGANQRRAACWTPCHHRLERLAMAVETWPMRLALLHSPDFIPPLNGRYRSVITIHDLTFLHYPAFLTTESRRYYNDQIDAAVARADHILADSEATRADVIDLLRVPPEKVTAVLLAADERFAPAPPETVARVVREHNLPSGYILFVGTFEPRKNLIGLLHAYAALRAGQPDAPGLVVAGRRGWLYDEIYRQVERLGLEAHITWAEDFPPADLPALYSGASVMCLPSFYEGFGLPALEAMACGTPVVVADRASLPEVVGEAGILIDPERPETITKALQRVLTDSTLAGALRTQGLQRAGRFSWRETARQTLAAYKQMLNG